MRLGSDSKTKKQVKHSTTPRLRRLSRKRQKGTKAKVEKGKSKKKIQRETTRDQDYVTSLLLSLAEFTEKNQLSKMHHASGYMKDGIK